ncbi:MAG: hypothetical protein M1820_006058 [Bogoriella megaspora]|nr:MAG: hypothetical protein M1820_006058 [Bogoriella megaspora]
MPSAVPRKASISMEQPIPPKPVLERKYSCSDLSIDQAQVKKSRISSRVSFNEKIDIHFVEADDTSDDEDVGSLHDLLFDDDFPAGRRYKGSRVTVSFARDKKAAAFADDRILALTDMELFCSGILLGCSGSMLCVALLLAFQ